MKAGDILTVTIDRLGPKGTGLVDRDDIVLHVPGVAPGDRAEVRVESVSRQHPRAFASVRRRHLGKAARKPTCHHAAPTAGDCGGCPIMHVHDDAQRAAKRDWVNEQLGGWKTIDEVAASEPVGYRNRANFVVWRTSSGAVRLGSRARGGQSLARMDGCRILEPELSAVADRIADAATRLESPVGDAPGSLRYVGIRSDGAGRVLVEFVTHGEPDVLVRRAAADVFNAFESVVGLVESHNQSSGNAIRVARAEAVIGVDSLKAQVAGVPLELWSDTFAQLNWTVADRMARRVAELAAKDEGPILDLYSGNGVLGLAAATIGPRRAVIGAEVTQSAVDGATAAAEAVGVEATYRLADLADGIPSDLPAPGVIIVNPPRKGLHAKVRAAVASMSAPLIYMSCSADSLARDAEVFAAAGRTLESLEAHDMLPQTTHVELIARWSVPAD